MKRNILYIVFIVISCLLGCMRAHAQAVDTIRYVHPHGTYSNNGRSWEQAKDQVQDAINDLREYLRQNNLKSGSVYIAAGTYVPTESTETSGGSMLNTSFKIYEGIHVYGGFNPDAPEASPGQRKMRLHNGTYQTWDDNWNSRITIGSASPDEVAAMWEFAYPTILTGNHSSAAATFTFDEARGRYNTSYPSSSYHVVWFGTNGIIPTTDPELRNHYKAFTEPAWVDGCTIREGNASSRQTAVRDHMAYGGGAYMVGNTSLLNCIVERCNASIRGGGVYMDGGGTVDFCYINTCQASGVSIVQGYGGAVCIDYDGAVKHSYLTQSCARIGGGLSICHVPGEYPWEDRVRAEQGREPVAEDQIQPYSPFATACVVSNNTSNAEGGGVYLDEGGTVNHLTIVNNNCIGPDVTYYNRRHGRAGGIYIRNNGMMYNSYCWGNTCAANNDIQFASVKQTSTTTTIGSSTPRDTRNDTVFVYHCAFMNHDITDWSIVAKDQVSNLEKQNLPSSQSAAGNYVCITAPTAKAGVITPDGTNLMDGSYYYNVRNWHPRATSSIAEKGVQVTDAVQGASRWVQHAHTIYGVVGNTFEPVSSLGALVRDNENIRYAFVGPQSLEARNPKNTGTSLPTLFIDPNFKGCYDADGTAGYYDSDNHFQPTQYFGDSWDRPLHNLGEAINYFRRYLVEDPSQEPGKRAYYELPAYDEDGHQTGTERYDFVQILVKPGVLTTAGPGNYLGNEMRTASVRVLSHMRLYAAYPSSATGTNTEGRDPRTYTTRITANITGGLGAESFLNNSAHVVTFINTEFAVVDGFRLYNANTHDIQTTVSVLAGGGVLVNNRTTAKEKRIDMVGNELRNSVLANNFSPKGAGIYVNGEFEKSDGEVCAAGLYVVNCVIRNNTAHEDDHPTDPTAHGIITANGRAFIDLNHCTIVNNVGYPLKTDNAATEGDTEIPFHGFIQMNNSVVFANGDQMLDDRSNLGTDATVTVVNDAEENNTVFGSYNMFDFDIYAGKKDLDASDDAKLPRGFRTTFTPLSDAKTPLGRPIGLVYPYYTLELPSGNRMTVHEGAVGNNQANLTRASRTALTYPVFENPSRNVGHSMDNDKPLYGGTISYLPMNVNPVVNAANPNETYRGTYLDVDRSDVQPRNYGGAPDIGAIENHNLPPSGTVIYVTPEGRGKKDGSSWANAIAGNTVYQVVALGETNHKDINGEKVDVNIVYDNGAFVPTTDNRYRGGYSIGISASYKHVMLSTEVTKTVNQEQWSGTMDDDGNVTLESSTVKNAASPVTETIQSEDITQTKAGGEVDLSANFPYGERSGFSKDFWRTNQYNTSKPTTLSEIHITNEREEEYVGGLQYAVEKAAFLNKEKANPDDYVQVWVGNGTYDDYKSFIMRDKVSVYGGFPASTISAPGMAERRALVTEYTPLPDVYSSLKEQEGNYQTVLQISDKSPINENNQFDNSVILGQDIEVETHTFYKKTSTGTTYELTELLPLKVTRHPSEDITSAYIPNSTFDSNTDGWTCDAEVLKDKGWRKQTHTVGDVSMTNTIQLWSNANRTDLKNGVIWTAVAGLEAGTYTLQADAYTTGDEGGAHLMIQEVEGNNYEASLTKESTYQALTPITPKDKINHFSVTYTKQSATSTLIVGIRVFAGYSTGWVNADNFVLKKVDASTTEEVAVPINTIEYGDFESNPASDRWRGSGGTLWHNDNYNGNHVAEFSNTNFNRYQELQGLPDGTYLVTCRGFYRAGASGTSEVGRNALLYAIPDGGKEVNTPLPSIYSYTSKITSESGFTAANTTGTAYYVPNSRKTAAQVFVEEPGVYCSELLVTVTNNKLKLGVKNANKVANDWTCIDDLKIFKVVSQTKGTVSEEDSVSQSSISKVKSTVVRKPVLAMPDVCLPSYSPNDVTGGNDNVSNIDRMEKRREGNYTPKSGSGYKLYTDVLWDGFVIRNGYYYNYNSNRDGGAGVRLFEGGTLKNCVVTNNIFCANLRARSGGIYCDGLTANVISCFVIHNVATTVSNTKNLYGGGVYMIVGTCYNTLIANNVIKSNGGDNDIRGAGIFIEDATFYNNTIAYNKCLNSGGKVDTNNDHPGGIMHWSASTGDSKLSVFNTLVYKNSGRAIHSSNFDGLKPFLNCYVQSDSDLDNKSKAQITTENNNILLIGSGTETPFASAEAEEKNDFRLRSGSSCINTGLSEPNGITLPSTDVAFADRVQDCQVDIGAYEYDAAKDIRPDTLTHPGHAIFYISHAGADNGLASGDSPSNAACASKIQKVLDAAGRYKYALMTGTGYQVSEGTEPVAGKPNRYWNVEVRLAGDSTRCTDPTYSPDRYVPVRATDYERVAIGLVEDNTLNYSLIVPHGVQVLGGYSEDFYHYEDAAGNKVAAGTDDAIVVDERDPLTYRTVFSGKVTSNTGAEGQVYHVVTFTNDLFNTAERLYTDDYGNAITGQLASCTDERDRAVLDGLFIEDGFANSPDEEDRIGAAAVVTDYAHVRNCVVQNNEALRYGGGLYLEPGALVSGTIVRNNSAQTGGGIYVNPDERKEHTGKVARIFTTTISANTANTSAGGLWFSSETANLRANSIVLWGNTSNDFANVAGIFSAITQEDGKIIYPFTYAAVEVRDIEGQGNIELSAVEVEGVRWDRQDPFNTILYYPIEMSSILARSGMTYGEWNNFAELYPTLSATDIAGVSRIGWQTWGTTADKRLDPWNDTLVIKNNDFIDIGARAINRNYEVQVDPEHVMRRLYVMHTAILNENSKYARALQDNINARQVPVREAGESDEDFQTRQQQHEAAVMYAQQGSCFVNPMFRFSDALKYVARMRTREPDKYRDARFEIYLEHGKYEPGNNAYGEHAQTRTNTFTVPEGVTIVGGLEHETELGGKNYFCQAGFEDLYHEYEEFDATDIHVSVYDPMTEEFHHEVVNLKRATIDEIRASRPMVDLNQNSIIEPWEFQRQSRLTGTKTNSDGEQINVYHIITCFADPQQLGSLPKRYKSFSRDSETGRYTLSDPTDNPDEECEQSKVHRSVILDGLIITGGYANNINAEDAAEDNAHPYTKKTYFRGGGILVDGNWTADFDLNNDKIPSVLDAAEHNIPLVVRCCLFQDNMAGNGGAIYSNGDLRIYSSHFTQNYSQGPINKRDAKFIPWSAGGCIATNAYCGVVNCLFANNEALRGNYPIEVSGEESITDAEIRQGFAGVISSSETSTVRAFNCNFVSNKAVGYPAIFNFLPNSYYDGKEHSDKELGADKNGTARQFGTKRHFAINCLFWNNRATADTLRSTTSDLIYVHNNDIFNLGYADADENTNVVRGNDNNRGVFFSAYEAGYGSVATQPDPEAADEAYRDIDYRTIKVDENTLSTDFDDARNITNLLSYVDTLGNKIKFNHNVTIDSQNNVTGGPNFVQPATSPGLNGYMQNADWLISRINRLTDAGWGYLNQDVSRVVDHYEIAGVEDKFYPADYGDVLTNRKGAEDAAHTAAATAAANAGKTAAEVYAIYRAEAANFTETTEEAMYNYYSRVHEEEFHQQLMPVGNQHYMSYTREGDTEQKEMHRISGNPKLNVNQAYIDIGVYEYQYVQIDLPGNEIDTVWVAPTNLNPVNYDGLTWATPTSDMQYAIELLLRSANNHDKYICLIQDGDHPEAEFSPSLTIDNRKAYVVEMPQDGNTILLPDRAVNNIDYGVRSLTFLGGWSSKAKLRDPEQYPTVVSMQSAADKDELNQLFVVEDMQRYNMQRTFRADQIAFSDTVMPITFDGITFHNTYGITNEHYRTAQGKETERGGAAIYYRYQREYQNELHENERIHAMDKPLQPSRDTANANYILPKLTISNCIFFDNGERTTIASDDDKQHRSPAVRIDDGGGGSLVVNSLFHSNAGAPVYTHETEAVTRQKDSKPEMLNCLRVVNSTFALNDGHIDMSCPSSELHNSLIWKDDLLNDTLTQLRLGDTEYKRGTTQQGIADQLTHNAVFGAVLVDDETSPDYEKLANDSLASDNTDVFIGPNFVNPYEAASNSYQYAQRNFHLNPSVLTMNRADTMVYRQRVFTVTPTVRRRPHGIDMRSSASIVSVTQDMDLAYKPRLQSSGMERGAYECTAILQRVLYVIPSNTQGGNGSSWQKAFGQGQLQNAIDVAAVYSYMYRNVSDEESRRSYVFVKGSGEGQTEPAVNFREGVQVFGSLPTSFLDTVYLDRVKNAYTNEECQRFVNLVRASEYGVASPATTPTRIMGAHSDSDSEPFRTVALLDGFHITGNSDFTTSPVNSHNTGIVMRNLLISGNSAAESEYDTRTPHTALPLVNLQKGLLYNTLICGNRAATAVRVGDAGLMLGCTVATEDESATTVDATDAIAGAVAGSLTVAGYAASGYKEDPKTARVGESDRFYACNSLTGMFAPYLTTQNVYDLPAYLTQNEPLAYQLHEHSSAINAVDTLLTGLKAQNAWWNQIPHTYLNLASDRDILGNPRVIGGRMDIGAVETWYVPKNGMLSLTALTNPVKAIPDNEEKEANENEKRGAYLLNYGGNVYPHAGSVVYLMDSSAMTTQYQKPDFEDIVLRPGYMLLQSGASFYGNGYNVQMNYVAAEKKFINQRYSMTALPYDYSVANIISTAYTPSDDRLVESLRPVPFHSYRYSGAARSAKDYVFQTDNSSLWLPVDTLNRTAAEGYLMDFGAAQDTVLRFTAFGAALGSYVYTESEDEPDKAVYLTQYDNRVPGSGTTFNFTRQEDMGWNMKGLPWLVSDYRTDTVLWEDNFLRQMYIPHVFYQMDGAGEYLTTGDQMYASRSWDRGAVMAMGNAFLTQTATTKDKEKIIFHLPYYGRNGQVPRPILKMASSRSHPMSDYLVAVPDSAANKAVQYAYGRDGIKWNSNSATAQLYMLDSKRQAQIALLGSAPTEVDIPLGVSIPNITPTLSQGEGASPFGEDGREVTFSLPEKEAFDGYPYIWLIDYAHRSYINLLEEDYTTTLDPGVNNTRFALRIGGFPKTDNTGRRQYEVFATDMTLYIRGLVTGDKITVYSSAGQLICTTTATGSEFTMPLPFTAGYVVKVNDTSHKVIAI